MVDLASLIIIRIQAISVIVTFNAYKLQAIKLAFGKAAVHLTNNNQLTYNNACPTIILDILACIFQIVHRIIGLISIFIDVNQLPIVMCFFPYFAHDYVFNLLYNTIT